MVRPENNTTFQQWLWCLFAYKQLGKCRVQETFTVNKQEKQALNHEIIHETVFYIVLQNLTL